MKEQQVKKTFLPQDIAVLTAALAAGRPACANSKYFVNLLVF